MRQFSLTRRITATVLGCQLLLAAGLTLATVLFGRAQLRRAFDETLTGRAMSTLALVRYKESNPLELVFDNELIPPSSDSVHKDLFEIRRVTGQTVARSDDPVPAIAQQASA